MQRRVTKITTFHHFPFIYTGMSKIKPYDKNGILFTMLMAVYNVIKT